MISETAWQNIHWLRKSFFSQLPNYGGVIIAVDSFRPYLKRSWIEQLDSGMARQQLFDDVTSWAREISRTHLTAEVKLPGWDGWLQQAYDHGRYSELTWFLIRAHYNLYCLSTHRKTIEELALGAYVYCSKSIEHTEEIDRAAIGDLRKLVRLSKSFLMAEWVHDMIVRAIANRDRYFFNVLSNALNAELLAEPSPTAVQWLQVMLLWFMGGNDYSPRRLFLHELQLHGILPREMGETSFTSELKRLGLTTV